MRRFLIAILCCLLLTTAVSAASSVTDLQSTTNVSSDGTCQVSLTIQLRLEEAPSADLTFPLPADARDITLNGDSVRAKVTGGYRQVDLSKVVPGAGVYTFTIYYEMPDSVVADEDDQLQLEISLLSGFDYPIDAMTFTVTLPGETASRPAFMSTYYQEAVDSLMTLTLDGATIRGSFSQPLMDRESLSMTLAVTEDLFPQPVSKKWSLSTDDIAMFGCVVLALVYWLLTMRCLPPRRIRQATEPDGLTAGELGCALTAQGVDLTMMVISWARMGYLLIQLDDNGRVLLHKRMDMGNERSDFENRYFRNLFGRRRTVDGTGYHYARLCRKAAGTATNLKDYYLRRSGNPRIFRILCTGIGLFGGISMASAFVNDTAWRVILSIFLSILGVLVSWLIQSAAATVHLRKKQKAWIALVCCVLWLLLGTWAGEWGVAVFVILTQWLAGFAAAYGGRRSEIGRLTMSQILGLRRYMRTASKKELRRSLHLNPDYFYSLAPFALALGVDRAFARQFGDERLTGCTWLTSGMDGHMTPREWNQLLRDAVAALDERQQRLALEKIMGR